MYLLGQPNAQVSEVGGDGIMNGVVGEARSISLGVYDMYRNAIDTTAGVLVNATVSRGGHGSSSQRACSLHGFVTRWRLAGGSHGAYGRHEHLDHNVCKSAPKSG